MSARRSARSYLEPTPIALAHRGGALHGENIGLENTLTAFRNAVALGYTHIETDVHLTADGQLVAFHDDVLDRVTDGHGAIAALPLAEVQQASLGGIERVPLFAEVLEELPDTKFNVDLKAPGTAAAMWSLIEAHGWQERFCVGSFSQREISAFRRLAKGTVVTAAAQAGTVLMRFGPKMFSRLARTPADVFQIPVTHVIRGRKVTVVTDKLIEVAHRHGKQVHVWTIDEADQMNELLDRGVDGLVSDRIDVLKDVLLQRGSWTGT